MVKTHTDFLEWLAAVQARREPYVTDGPSSMELQAQADLDAERAPLTDSSSRIAAAQFARMAREGRRQ